MVTSGERPSLYQPLLEPLGHLDSEHYLMSPPGGYTIRCHLDCELDVGGVGVIHQAHQVIIQHSGQHAVRIITSLFTVFVE